MESRRNPFADFERMRRGMDELVDAFLDRPTLVRRAAGFSPRVDVYYSGTPAPRAVIKAELAGVPLDSVNLEVTGRELVITGERPVQEREGRVYQQLEIDSGPFKRVVELSADVDPENSTATYDDGILRVELPLLRDAEQVRRVEVRRSEG